MAPERAAQLVACVAAVGECVAQPGEAMADGLEQVRRPVAVLHARGVDDHERQEPDRVAETTPLEALGLLAGVEAANPAAFGDFDALAVDHARRWASLASLQLDTRKNLPDSPAAMSAKQGFAASSSAWLARLEPHTTLPVRRRFMTHGRIAFLVSTPLREKRSAAGDRTDCGGVQPTRDASYTRGFVERSG